MTRVELSSAARRELLDARTFYAAVTPALGKRFESTIDAVLQRIVVAIAHQRRRFGYWQGR